MIVGIGVTIFLFGFAAGLFLGAAVGSGKAQDSYDAGYAAGLREVHGIGGIAERMEALTHELCGRNGRDLGAIERLYAAETDE